MQVQISSAVFMPLDPISVLLFRNNFETACDSNRIHQEITIWLLPHFTKKSDRAILLQGVSANEDNDAQKGGKFKISCQVVNYLHETYAKDDVIAGAEANSLDYKKNREYVHRLLLRNTLGKGTKMWTSLPMRQNSRICSQENYII